MMIKT